MPAPSTERHEARRKKKNFYAQLKKQEDTKLQELAEKYRDRARERRDGSGADYQAMDPTGANAYRAVAPDSKSGLDAAERRRQLIQESKFLGGDMEHTHLVKGLDYALLQKVRSEIIVQEQEEEIEMEKMAEIAEQKAEEERAADEEAQHFVENEHRTVIGRNIFNTIQFYRSRNVERNELFAGGRMAYVIDLDDDDESDIPTTLIRSKADVPQNAEEIQTLTTNDIVINKLAQILLYLRQGGKGRKNKKRDKDKMLQDDDVDVTDSRGHSSRDTKNEKPRDKEADISIYDDLDEYKPSKRSDKDGSSSSKNRNRKYFDKSSEQEEREAGGSSGKRKDWETFDFSATLLFKNVILLHFDSAN